MGCELSMSLVSGVESREGPVCEALSGPLPGDLAEGDTDLSVFCSVVCACTEVFRGCGNTAVNFQHLQETEKVPLVDTGLILEFVHCCQNLSVKE